ncbi:ABC transporter substrate-binding protein [Aquabacterium sp.]|uniref:ABC transporter substrate-binding protein n=1 Tax=Aquabacterium sp. TaxID=1872578 RepID=UPI002487A4F6|nr:ABC transporter substrate-binding protein [Aquabacterium sp.]MDI1347652.1 ABC transporter substrate-binding protein [Aquabacterium sp.]
MNRRDLLLGGAGASCRWLTPLGGLTACSTATPALRVALNGWIGYSPLFLAQELGHAPESAVRLLEFPSNTASMMALFNGEVAAAALTLDEVLLAREGGLDVRAALVFDESAGADVLMAREGIDGLTSLRGKRIGVEATGVGALMLSRALEAAQLAPTDVVKVPLTADQHVAAYTDQHIDAVITFEPMASRLRALGARPLLDSSRFPGLIVDVLAVSAQIDPRQAEQLRQLLDGHFQALQHLRSNPANAARLLAQHQQIAPDAVLAAFRGIRLADAAANRGWLSGQNPGLNASARSVGQLMVHAKLLQRLPDTATLCDPRFLPEAA